MKTGSCMVFSTSLSLFWTIAVIEPKPSKSSLGSSSSTFASTSYNFYWFDIFYYTKLWILTFGTALERICFLAKILEPASLLIGIATSLLRFASSWSSIVSWAIAAVTSDSWAAIYSTCYWALNRLASCSSFLSYSSLSFSPILLINALKIPSTSKPLLILTALVLPTKSITVAREAPYKDMYFILLISSILLKLL